MPIPQAKPDLAPKTARERIYTVLRNWIIDGTLQPDEKIYDHEIAQYFSVSRTPVREAFQLLADQKLLIILPGKESRVAPIDPEKSHQAYMILAELQALAVQLALPAVDEAQLHTLTCINDRFKKAVQHNDIELSRSLDQDFHNVFLQLSGNDFLQNFSSILCIHVDRIEHLYFDPQSRIKEGSVKCHEAIIEALKTRDAETAARLMRENWLSTVEILKD